MLIFGVGIILFTQLVYVDIVYTEFGTSRAYTAWERSIFATHWFRPLMVTAFVSCAVFPIFSVMRVSQRLVLGVVGIGLGILAYFGSGFVLFLIYGV